MPDLLSNVFWNLTPPLKVIGLLDLFTPSTSIDNFSEVYLVNQLMSSDLNKIIKSQRLSDAHIRFLVYQILRGLKYIHSAGVIHRASWQSSKRKLFLV